MPRPRTIDPADLGPRQIAGYFAVWDSPRGARSEDGERYTETLRPSVFDDELEAYGPAHPWPCHWDHSAPGIPDFDHVATVPIGRSLTVEPDDYGPFTIVELRPGRLADETLAAARAGDLGFSYHGTDFDPEIEERDGRLYVTRHRMALREITLTGRPAEPGALVVAVGSEIRNAIADLGLLRDTAGEDLISRVVGFIEDTGGNVASLKLRTEWERAERERAEDRRTTELADRIRGLAFMVTEGHRQAAALRDLAGREAGRWPPDPHRPPAVLIAEAVLAGAQAERAGAELRELCQNDRALVAAVIEEARTS